MALPKAKWCLDFGAASRTESQAKYSEKNLPIA
jgi:hypothetical protein